MIIDSGNRQEFDTGAVRDIHEGKGRCDLIPWYAISTLGYSCNIMHNLMGAYNLLYRNNSVIKFTINDCDLVKAAVKNFRCAFDLFIKEAYTNDGLTVETALLDLSIHFEEGAVKYGVDNWKKGIPLQCYINSAIRHYLKFRRGDTDESHKIAVLWNIVCATYEVNALWGHYHN